MYQERLKYQSEAPTTDSSETTTDPALCTLEWDCLSMGQKMAIISFVSTTALIVLILVLKQFGEWIGYRWSTRRHKNMAITVHRSDSEGSINEPRIHFIDISGMSPAERSRTINHFRNQMSHDRHPLGPDLPPAYNEALHLETLDFGNGLTSLTCDLEPDFDCPPPSYWNSAIHPKGMDDENGFR